MSFIPSAARDILRFRTASPCPSASLFSLSLRSPKLLLTFLLLPCLLTPLSSILSSQHMFLFRGVARDSSHYTYSSAIWFPLHCLHNFALVSFPLLISLSPVFHSPHKCMLSPYHHFSYSYTALLSLSFISRPFPYQSFPPPLPSLPSLLPTLSSISILIPHRCLPPSSPSASFIVLPFLHRHSLHYHPSLFFFP